MWTSSTRLRGKRRDIYGIYKRGISEFIGVRYGACITQILVYWIAYQEIYILVDFLFK